MSSCSSGPRASCVDLPDEALSKVAADANEDALIEFTACIPDEWWIIFNDAQLTSFIETAFQRNPTLQIAQANIFAAAYHAKQVRATLFPTLGLGGDVSRQKLSQTALIPFDLSTSPTATPGGSGLPAPGGFAGIPVYFTQTETELSLFYDFDIWDKNRNLLRAAAGEFQAKIADEAFTKLQLGIAVAKVYFQLQIDYARQTIAEALVKNKTEYLDLIQQRFSGNLDNLQATYSARTNLATVKQQLLQIQGDIAVNECQLRAYLAGDFQEEILNLNITERPLPRVPIPSDLPLSLLARRPDITAQLWLIESAGRQIESARAGFYPDFNINAFLGYQTIHIRELFNKPSSFFNVDPAFTLPIFEGGRLIANLRGSEVNYDLAIYQYNNLIIDAVRDVIEGIVVLRNREAQLNEYQDSRNFQENLFDLTKLRVENNLGSGLDYLIFEQNVLAARDQETAAMGETIQAMLSLIKALGGGYDNRQ